VSRDPDPGDSYVPVRVRHKPPSWGSDEPHVMEKLRNLKRLLEKMDAAIRVLDKSHDLATNEARLRAAERERVDEEIKRRLDKVEGLAGQVESLKHRLDATAEAQIDLATQEERASRRASATALAGGGALGAIAAAVVQIIQAIWGAG
jgi:hypothetical protein